MIIFGYSVSSPLKNSGIKKLGLMFSFWNIFRLKEKLSYENRSTIMQEMDDKAQTKAEAGWRIDAPEISNTITPLILSARPGTQAWFSHASKAGLSYFEDFPQEAKDKLPCKVMRCQDQNYFPFNRN